LLFRLRLGGPGTVRSPRRPEEHSMTVPKILLSCAAALAFGCATTESAAPASATLVTQLFAKGTQNYRCQATSTAGAAEWKLVAPEAELFRAAEPGAELAGTHG